MVIDERQQPEPLPADQLIGHEVHAPALIGLPGRRTCLANLDALPPTWLSPPDSKALLALQPVDELRVREPPFATQKHPESWVSELHPAGRQVSKSNAKFGPRVTPALPAEARSSESERPACPTRLAERERDALIRDVLLSHPKNQPFPVMPRFTNLTSWMDQETGRMSNPSRRNRIEQRGSDSSPCGPSSSRSGELNHRRKRRRPGCSDGATWTNDRRLAGVDAAVPSPGREGLTPHGRRMRRSCCCGISSEGLIIARFVRWPRVRCVPSGGSPGPSRSRARAR